MGKFSGINNLSGSGNGSYFEPGVYLAKIANVEWRKDGFKGESYILNFEITKVLLHRDAETRDNGEGKTLKFNASRKVGDVVSHVLKIDGEYKTMALGNLADFLRASFATMKAQSGELVDPKEIDIGEEDPVEAAGVDQPLVGLELEVQVQGTITVKKKGAFNSITYKVPRTLVEQFAA